jgi:hypothetical protein
MGALASSDDVDPVFIAKHGVEQQAYGDALMDRAELHEIVSAEVRRSPRVQWGMKEGEPFYMHSHEQIELGWTGRRISLALPRLGRGFTPNSLGWVRATGETG